MVPLLAGADLMPVMVAVVAIMGSMLAVIAFFLSRILTQFDTLNTTVVQLNGTMLKIDKDLTGEIVHLKATQLRHTDELRGLNSVYDRLRITEQQVSVLASKCDEMTGRQ